MLRLSKKSIMIMVYIQIKSSFQDLLVFLALLAFAKLSPAAEASGEGLSGARKGQFNSGGCLKS